MKKRILSILMMLALLVCLLPAAVQEAQAASIDTITGIIATGDGYWKSFGSYYLDTDNSGLVTASGASANVTITIGPLCTDRSASSSTQLQTEPELGETYYFWYKISQPAMAINISNAASTIEYTGFCNGTVLEASDLYSDGDIFVICSIMYGELTGGVKAIATGVAFDSEKGGYAPQFTTLKCVSTDGEVLDPVTSGENSYYGVDYSCFYKNTSGTQPLTTQPEIGITYYAYFDLESADGELHIDEDLVDIQIPGFDVDYMTSIKRSGGISRVVYSATKKAAPDVYVNGVGLFDGDYLAVGASTTTTTAPSGGYAYYNEGTLTLSNYSYTGLGTAFQHPGTAATYDAVVYAPGALTVNLVGTNTLTVTGSNAGSVVNNCIWTAYDLTVQGNGSLTMEGADTGIAVFVGDLTVNSGRIVTRNVRNSLESWNKNIVINGGELDLSSPNSGIYADGALRINGGLVTAVGSYRAINRGEEFGVSDSLKIRASTTEDGPLGEYVAADHDTYKKICIMGPDIYVGGVGMITGEYLAAGATETTTAAPGGGYAYYSNGTLTLNGYSYEGPGHKYNTTWSYYAVIYAKHDLTIDLVGANTLVQTAEESDSVHIDNGNLTIVGTGSLTNTDNHYGLYARKNVTVNSGTVVSNSGHSGLNSGNGNVVINGGNVTVSGKYGIITPYGSSYFTGGKITATGSYQAIYSNINVDDGMTVQASTTADGALVEYVEADHARYLKIVIEEPLEAPTLKASNVASTGKIKLTWNAVEGAAKYQVVRSTDNKNWSHLTYSTGTSVTNTKTDAGKTYYYKIRTIDANGNKSPYSKVVSRMCDLPQPTATVSNVASTGKIKLTWNKVEGAAKYEVYRSTSQSGTYTKLITTTGTSVTNTSVGVGETYYYKVRAVHSSSSANSAYSAIVSRTCDLPQVTGVSVSNDAATGKVKLSWDKVEGAAKYEVYSSTSKSGTYTKVATVTGTGVTDTAAAAGQTYYYKVRAVHSNSSANSAYSAVVSRTCDLAKPQVTASNDAATGKIKLTWNKVEGAAKYEVYRSTSQSGTYTKLTTVTGTSVTNTSAGVGETYYYKVRAIHSNSSANSVYSSVVSRTCDLPQPQVTVTNVASTGKIKLTWNKVEGAVKYEVYRSTSQSGTYTKLITTTGTSVTNTSVGVGETYYYKVRAVHSSSSANSAYSPVVSKTCTLTQPAATVTLNSKGKPVVTWGTVDGAVKYTIYIYDANGTLLKTTSTTGLKVTHSSAEKGTTYKYQVVAVHSNTAANSARSAVVSIKSN